MIRSGLLLLLACSLPAVDTGFGATEDDATDDRNTFDAFVWHQCKPEGRPAYMAWGTYTVITDRQAETRVDEAAVEIVSPMSSWADFTLGAFYQGNLGGKRLQAGWHRMNGDAVYSCAYAYDKEPTLRPTVGTHLHWGYLTADGVYRGDSGWGRVGWGGSWADVAVEVWARSWWGHDYAGAARHYHDEVGKVGITLALVGKMTPIGCPTASVTACDRDVRFGLAFAW